MKIITKEKAGEEDFWIDDWQKKRMHFLARDIAKMYGKEAAEKKKNKKG